MENKKKKRKITKSESITRTDSDGVVTNSMLHNTYAVSKEPPYIKVYIDDISRLVDLPKGMNRILFQLLKYIGYNNILVAYKPIKMMVAINLGISLAYVDKCILAFVKKGLLVRFQRGMYIADPCLFGRGSWGEIEELIMIIRYNKDGTKVLSSSMSVEMQARMGITDEQLHLLKTLEEEKQIVINKNFIEEVEDKNDIQYSMDFENETDEGVLPK